MLRLLVLLLPMLFAACGDLDVRSVRTPTTSATAFAGEWAGAWTSSQVASTGSVVVRVQFFGDSPVVQLVIDNPCFEPREYELRVVDDTIELRIDGESLLDAELGDGELVGTYRCGADQGTWQAGFVRDLPEVVDLSGTWSGDLLVFGQQQRTLHLDLVQSAAGGAIRLDGFLQLSDWPLPIAVRGITTFRDEGFDLHLHTEVGSSPPLVLSGAGELQPLRVDPGLLEAVGPSPLPFQTGLFRIAPTP